MRSGQGPLQKRSFLITGVATSAGAARGAWLEGGRHMTRMIGYARVSTAEQKLDMQIDALKDAGCSRIFTDHGVSGGVASRPGLDKALSALACGDVLVVFKLDRLGRSVLHLADLITRLHKTGIRFRSISEGIDTTTPGGMLNYHVFAAVAEFQRDIIRENTICGLRAARDRGQKLGRPPSLCEYTILEAHRRIHQEGESVMTVARVLEVSDATIRRSFKRLQLEY